MKPFNNIDEFQKFCDTCNKDTVWRTFQDEDTGKFLEYCLEHEVED